MSVDRDTVIGIARLARVKVPDGELDGLAGELNGILGWIEQLAQVDTSGVEPMTSVVEVTLPLRKDAVSDGGDVERVTANAPEGTHGFFAVPKVVE